MITMDDTFRFEDFGLIPLVGHVNPLTPTLEHKTLAIPGRVGLWDFGAEIGQKEFTFPLGIIEHTHDRVELQRKLNNLVSFLLDEYGKPRDIKVVFDYEPNKYYHMKLAGQLDIERLYHTGEMELNMIAYDPYKYATVLSSEYHWDSKVITMDDDISIDHSYVKDLLITKSKTVDVYVNGLAIKPIINIVGSGDNVTLSANGKSFTLANFSNATYEIHPYTVYKNGVENMTDMTGQQLELLPGNNRINITGINLNFRLSITIRDKYI